MSAMTDTPPGAELVAQMRARLEAREILDWEILTVEERCAVQIILDEARRLWSGETG